MVEPSIWILIFLIPKPLLYVPCQKPPSIPFLFPVALRVTEEDKVRWAKCEMTDPRHSCSPYAHISSAYTNLLSSELTHSGALWIADIIDLFLARFLQNKVYDCRKVKPSHLIITTRRKDKVIWKVIIRNKQKQPLGFTNKPLNCQPQTLVATPLTRLRTDLLQACDAWVPLESPVVSELLFSADVIEQ